MQSLARVKAFKGGIAPTGIRLGGWTGLVRIMVVVSLLAVLGGPVKVSSAGSSGAASGQARPALKVPMRSGFNGPLASGGQDGAVDLTFNTGSGLSGPVGAVVVQNDGKILVGGSFTTYYNSSAKYITRLNADGTLDTTFNPGGSGPDSAVGVVAVQSDGKILIGGFFTTYNGVTANYFTRLNADGSRDTTFNSGGSGPNNFIQSLAVQSDGKILIGGAFATYNGVTTGRMVRLNADGSRDTNFNSGGSGANSSVFALAVQSDGKILVGGAFNAYNGVAVTYFIRLNTDGTLDTTFNSGGSGATPSITDIILQSDGKILIGGSFAIYNGVTVNNITRLNADGTLDTTFNSGGSGANSQLSAMAVQNDGKILVGGGFTTYNGVPANFFARLNADGTFDTTFNSGGAGPNSNVASIALQSDGKILVGGQFFAYNGVADSRMARLNTDGSRDIAFNPGVTGFNNAVFTVAMQGDGKLLAGGQYTAYNGVTAKFITRLNTDASLDTTFNSGGAGPNNSVRAVVVLSDGKILVGGQFTTYNGTNGINRIMRLNADGTLDTTFNSGGSGADNNVLALAVQNDGKILVGGAFITYNGVTVNRITRLNADGTLDTAFNSGGSGANSQLNAMAVQSDGKILVGGFFTTYNGVTVNRIARLNADGTLDTTFNSGGAGPNSSVTPMAIQSDGKILLGGAFTTYNGVTVNRITRLNADGTLDTTFNSGGSGADNNVLALAVQNDGKILVGGAFITYNGVTVNRITRLNADGTLDTSFNPGIGANSSVNAVAMQGDGKIIIGGIFTAVDTYTRDFIARLYNTAKAASSVTLSSTPNPSSYGQSVTFTATVSPIAASGTVTFTEGATTLGTGTLSGGVATFSTSSLTAGSHNISATYGGDSSYTGSTSNAVTQVVNQGSTTISLTSAPNSSTFGQSVTFTATVSPVAASGTVTFTEGATTLGTGSLSNGVATFSTSSLLVGSHDIVATYGGDSTYSGSSSSPVTQVVNQASTTTSLTSAPNPAALGQSVTFTATVAPISASGTVTFTEGATVLGTGTVSNGIATFATSSLGAGSHAINATYAGDGFYAGSSSNTVTQVVNQAATTLSLTNAPNPATFGQSVTFTATVAPIAASGTVTFTEGATTLGTGTLSGGIATFSTTGLSVGSHDVIATYGGDSSYSGSSSNTVTQVVNQASSSLTLSSSPNPATFGQSVTFTATVSPVAASGTVTFTDGVTTLGTGTLSNGVATFSTATLSVGSHNVTAAYGGDSSYATSSSNTVTQVVNQAATTLSLTSAPNPSIVGQSVTFTATVAPVAASGTVTFTEGATVLGTGTLSGGVATFSTASLSAGSHPIIATYGGDSSYAGSSSNTVTQVVNQVSTTLSLTSAPNPSIFGQSVTFTATVSPVAASGTVTFTEGATVLGTGTLASGVATFSTTSLPVGSHVISATYGGNSTYAGSTSNTVTQVVNTNCNPLVVTNINDNGAANTCGTFSYALVQASSGVTITFALTQSNTITFTGSLTPTVKSGVKIDGGSGAGGIVLYGNGVAGDGLRLMGNDTLINLTIRKFAGRELVTLGPGNVLKHVVIMQT